MHLSILPGPVEKNWYLHLRGEHGWPVLRRFLDLLAEVRRPGG
ncbi:MAG: hypothetical protein ACRDZR_09435 [Acidimicrobiales bacterium]